MTLKELEEKRDRAARAYDDSRDAAKNVQNLYAILSDMKKPGQDKAALEKLYADATAQVGCIVQAVQDVENAAREYRYHLDDVMRATKISWPPVCTDKE